MIEAHTGQILQNFAIATGKNKAVVMGMIDSLEQKGLARRTVNPEDRHENLLSITDSGGGSAGAVPRDRKTAFGRTTPGYSARGGCLFLRSDRGACRKERMK